MSLTPETKKFTPKATLIKHTGGRGREETFTIHAITDAPFCHFRALPVTVDFQEIQTNPSLPGVKVTLPIELVPGVKPLPIHTPLLHVFTLRADLPFNESQPFIELAVEDISGSITQTKGRGVLRYDDADIDDDNA